MTPRPGHPTTSPLIGLVLVATFVVALGPGASGSWISSADGAEKPGHHCACGPSCSGKTCCCKPDDSPEPPSTVPQPTTGIAPCMSAAPCGIPAVPTPHSVDPLGKASEISVVNPMGFPDAGRPLPLAPRCVLPDGHTSRIDDPPEDRPLA